MSNTKGNTLTKRIVLPRNMKNKHDGRSVNCCGKRKRELGSDSRKYLSLAAPKYSEILNKQINR